MLIANEQFTREQAEQVVASGDADAVAFGQAFIANPDLPARLAENAPLNSPKPELFYYLGNGTPSTGYTDYPALDSSIS